MSAGVFLHSVTPLTKATSCPARAGVFLHSVTPLTKATSCPASAGVCLCTCSGHCSAQDLAPAGITRKRPALKRRLFVFWRDVHFALFLIWSHSMLRTST